MEKNGVVDLPHFDEIEYGLYYLTEGSAISAREDSFFINSDTIKLLNQIDDAANILSNYTFSSYSTLISVKSLQHELGWFKPYIEVIFQKNKFNYNQEIHKANRWDRLYSLGKTFKKYKHTNIEDIFHKSHNKEELFLHGLKLFASEVSKELHTFEEYNNTTIYDVEINQYIKNTISKQKYSAWNPFKRFSFFQSLAKR